jgi:hypothetical protein
MTVNEETIEATLDSNGQLRLAHQPRLPPGPVRVTIRVAVACRPQRGLADGGIHVRLCFLFFSCEQKALAMASMSHRGGGTTERRPKGGSRNVPAASTASTNKAVVPLRRKCPKSWSRSSR